MYLFGREDLALCDELCGAVDAAVDALPGEQQRTAIWLREFQGLSDPQVGAAMSCTVGTVRSRIFRARYAINQHLRQMFDDARCAASGAGRATWRAVKCAEQITRELSISA
ncbi:MAG: sigma factor-like helix-turn-helix DNA-binding protein [Steroidobacteraceae bacterium]